MSNEMKDDVRRVWDIVSSSRHDRMEDALLADLLDAVPIIGDFANAARVKDAVENQPGRVVVVQAVDFVAGLVPVVGDIVDLITPTNTISYLLRKRGER